MKNISKNAKRAAMLALLFSAFALPLHAQQREKAEIEKCLKEHNCDCAQKFYDVYKKLSGRTNKDIERRITDCRGWDSTDLQQTVSIISEQIDWGNYESAINIYNQNKAKGMSFSEDTEVEMRCLQGWLSGYFDNCIEETPRFNAGIAMPMPEPSMVNKVAEKRMRTIANFAKAHYNEISTIYVVGFRNNLGSDEYNMKISEKAAETVAKRLVELGVDKAKVEATGKGKSSFPSFQYRVPWNTIVAVFVNSKDFENTHSNSADYHKNNLFARTEFFSFNLFHTMPSGNKFVGDLNPESTYDIAIFGEVVDGHPKGHCTVYFGSNDPYGRISLEGEWTAGVDLKRGTIRWADGCWYEGEFRNGNINGHGTFHWANGDSYTGSFLNGKKHGQGTYIWATGRYEGTFANDRMNGNGNLFSLGISYKGGFVDEKRSGHGICCLKGGGWSSNYEGEWKDGLRNGTFKIYEGAPFDTRDDDNTVIEQWNMGSPVYD